MVQSYSPYRIRSALSLIETFPIRPQRRTNMEHQRAEIWDHLYRSGPLTVEQIADRLRMDAVTVTAVVEHEWFDVLDSIVRIATGKPPNATSGLIG